MNAYSDWLEVLSGIHPSPDSPLFPRIYKGDRIGTEAMVSLSGLCTHTDNLICDVCA
jgi:hypothetical protein